MKWARICGYLLTPIIDENGTEEDTYNNVEDGGEEGDEGGDDGFREASVSS